MCVDPITMMAMAGSAISAGGALAQGKQAEAMANYQAQVYQRQAQQEQQASAYEQSRERHRQELQQAAARAQVGASGVALQGSPAEVLAANAQAGRAGRPGDALRLAAAAERADHAGRHFAVRRPTGAAGELHRRRLDAAVAASATPCAWARCASSRAYQDAPCHGLRADGQNSLDGRAAAPRSRAGRQLSAGRRADRRGAHRVRQRHRPRWRKSSMPQGAPGHLRRQSSGGGVPDSRVALGEQERCPTRRPMAPTSSPELYGEVDPVTGRVAKPGSFDQRLQRDGGADAGKPAAAVPRQARAVPAEGPAAAGRRSRSIGGGSTRASRPRSRSTSSSTRSSSPIRTIRRSSPISRRAARR